MITFLLAAVAPILAITSATLSMHDLVDLKKNEHALREEAIRLADEQEGANESEEE